MAENFRSERAAVEQIEAVPRILNVVCRVTGMGFAAIARVTEDRWIACSVRDSGALGPAPGAEFKIEATVCHEVRLHREAVVINRLSESEAFCGRKMPEFYGYQSLISMPIILPDGRFFGTLCAFDPQPDRVTTAEGVEMFKLFAELIAFHLAALEQAKASDQQHAEDRELIAISERRRIQALEELANSEARHMRALEQITAGEARLSGEQHSSKLREEFIAVLGHDLRNPLSAIKAGVELLTRTPLTDRGVRVAGIIQASAMRISSLIDDMMDFARGQLGGGLALEHTSMEPLEPVLRQVITELQASHPARDINVEIELALPVKCDPSRLSQLLSNLLGNALIHGADNSPIEVRSVTDQANFELSVANAGTPIPPDVLETLFEPFARGASNPNQPGLGLGLFIASEIAKAHGGTLVASSSPAETRFTLRMPRL
jgi:signal transduction histidine kinase